MNKFLKILSLIVFLAVFGCDDREKKVLVVGTSADYPPFSFTKGKQIVGFDVDLAKEVAIKLGYELHIKDMNFSELIPAVKKKKVDCAIAAITATPNRAREIDFSTVKYYLPKFALMYTRSKPVTSIKALEHKTIAVQKGSTMESFLKERLSAVRNARIVSFERTSLMLDDLKKGNVDCILIELMEAETFCSADKVFAHSLLRSPSNDNYAIAFPRGSKLRAKVDDVVLRLKVLNEFDRLKEKWFKPNLD